MKAQKGFTLAEVLITLAIIGIIATIILPVFVNNVMQRVCDSASDLIVKKIKEATRQMNADDDLSGFVTTDAFADEFQKYIKIIQRCNTTNMSRCFVTGFRSGSGDDISLSSLLKGTDLGQVGNTSDLVGMQLINGTNAIIAFNPTCARLDPYNTASDTTTCLAILYDVNGFAKPNIIGIDIVTLNATIAACSGKKLGNLCIDTGDTTFDSYGTFTSMMSNYPNYQAGAEKACEDKSMRLPNQTELDTMYASKASIGMSASTGTYWSSTDYAPSASWAQTFSDGTQSHIGKNNTTLSARCVK